MPIRPLSKTLQSMAEEQLNEVPAEIEEKLGHLREWINKQPHLKCRLEDQWLLAFLRGCKFSLQKTKDKLDSYYSARSVIPEFFYDRDPFATEVEEYFKRCYVVQCSLPVKEESPQPIVTLIRIKDYDIDKFPFEVSFKIGLMLVDLEMYTNDRYLIAGEQMVIDLKGLNSSMLTQFTPANIRKAIHIVNIAYPIRFKGILYINSPSLFVSVFNATKSLLPEKVLNKIRIYGDDGVEQLHKTVPPSLLPTEYGGNAGTLEELSTQLYKKILTHKDWFTEDKSYGTDESKRIEPLKNYDYYGIEGSFRQLIVD